MLRNPRRMFLPPLLGVEWLTRYRQSFSRLLILIWAPSTNETLCGKVSPDARLKVVGSDYLGNRMSGLIDSLMGKLPSLRAKAPKVPTNVSFTENFYVPPVIFNVQAIKAEDGTERWRRTCVDGKQRLTSIRDFMKGRIPCHDRRGATWYALLHQGYPVCRKLGAYWVWSVL